MKTRQSKLRGFRRGSWATDSGDNCWYPYNSQKGGFSLLLFRHYSHSLIFTNAIGMGDWNKKNGGGFRAKQSREGASSIAKDLIDSEDPKSFI